MRNVIRWEVKNFSCASAFLYENLADGNLVKGSSLQIAWQQHYLLSFALVLTTFLFQHLELEMFS